MFIDYLAEQFNLSLIPSRYEFYAAEGVHEGNQFALMKPTTFVNNSGNSIAQFQQQYKIKSEDLLIVYDDLNIPLSEVRIRFGGSHGGHNGIYSIIYHLNTNQFPRLRFGIGSPYEKGKMAQFVLGKLSYDEHEQAISAFAYSHKLVQAFINGGLKQMLDENSQLKDPGNPPPPNEQQHADAAGEADAEENGSAPASFDDAPAPSEE
jgi:PTH1 family peptidyl-tRNA hydrolase